MVRKASLMPQEAREKCKWSFKTNRFLKDFLLFWICSANPAIEPRIFTGFLHEDQLIVALELFIPVRFKRG
jgi:hypothetical protein